MSQTESSSGEAFRVQLAVSPSPNSPVKTSDFADSEVEVKSWIAGWMAAARSPDDTQSPAWKAGHSQIQELKSTLCTRAGEVFGNIGKSPSSRVRLNGALKLRPPLTDQDGNQWRMQVEHINETGACRLVWVPSRPDEQNKYDVVATPLIRNIDELDILNADKLRDGIHKACRLTATGFDERRKHRALNAAIRARLLKFDAEDIDLAASPSRKSEFSKGDENKMDSALIALFLRMEEWDYCHRVLARHNDLATLGYVSAGPLEPGKSEPSTLFKAHADNFVWDDLCWQKPANDQGQVVLCFSGFRLHPELTRLEGVGKVLLRAALEVCVDFKRDNWPIERVLLSLHQPAARSVFNDLAGTSFGNRTSDFVELSTTQLEKLANGRTD